MFISPSKLKKNKILRNRTLNFETVQRNKGNLVFVPSTSRDAIIATFNSGLFRPMQLLAAYTPRKYKPLNRQPVIVDQKDFYSRLKSDTYGRFKKGKVVFNAYNGQNLFYDIYEEYLGNYEAISKLTKSGVTLQARMFKYLVDKLSSASNDPDYQKSYVILPIYDYNPKLRQQVNMPSTNVDPVVLFMQYFFKGNFTEKLPDTISLYLFYNPNANAIVVVDSKDPNFEKDKGAIFQKILRLNAYNAKGKEHDNLDDDADVESSIPDNELSDEDKLENKKEEIKKVVFSKVAKTLHADNLTDFEAASQDEQGLMMAIDDKVDKYLEKDSNLKKTFNDMLSDVEKDDDVKAKAIRYVEAKKSSTQRLENHSKGLEKETEIISTLQDLNDESKTNDGDKFNVAMDDIDPRIEVSHLSSIDDEYNKKQFMIDLTNIISAFSNSEYLPLTVDDVKLEDTSDERDLKKTLSVRYKTDDGKPLSFQIDIPDIVDKRYLFLGGNKKVIKKQMIRLPIAKVKNDRVEMTTNYNKLTIERTNGKLSRRNAYLLKNLKAYENNKAYTIVYGYNAVANGSTDYINDYEYEEFGNNVTSLETPKYKMLFNRPLMEKEVELLDVPEDYFGLNSSKTPFGLAKKIDTYTGVVFINNKNRSVWLYDIPTKTIKELAPSMFDFIAKEFNMNLTNLPNIGKSFIYTYLRFLKENYPLFAVVGSQIGLTGTLKRYNLRYKISKKRLPASPDWVEMKFKDCYLYYEGSIRATLLLNALYLLDPDEYEYSAFDTDVPYTKYFMKKFGDALGMHVKNTLKVNLGVFVDPITKDILKDMHLPTNIIDLLLYGNSLLVGNQYKPLSNVSNYRIRSNELICDCLYGIIADAYVSYQRHRLNGKPTNLKIDRRELIKRLLAQENVNDKSTLNPTIEAEQIAQASAKGYNGVNLNAAYTLEMRVYNDSMNGYLSGNATPYSGQAGITRSLSYDPKISTVRGYMPEIKDQDLSATNMLSPTELLASFTSTGADSPRQAMQVAQTGHTMPILHSSKQLIGSGMNKTLAFMLSDDFCFHAKKDGVVAKIDDTHKLALLNYDDGTRDAIDLSDKLDKNSNMGFYIHQNFAMCYKEGEHFQAGDILALNPNYFSGKGKNVDYHPGALAKVAVASGDFSFEDSTLISESLGKKCAAKVDMLKQVVLGKNAVIYKMKDVGEHIDAGDDLIDFTSSFDDPDTAAFVTKLSGNIDSEYLDDITHEQVKSKYAGEITKIEVVYNAPFEELSESLQKVIKKFQGRAIARKKALEGIKADAVHIPPVEQVSSKKNIKEEFPAEGGVIINIWVEYVSVMDKGDKLTYNTALKGVISRVVPDNEAPITEYRPEDHIEGVLTPTGVISRMTADIYKLLYSNKVLVELGKQIREIWRGER